MPLNSRFPVEGLRMIYKTFANNRFKPQIYIYIYMYKHAYNHAIPYINQQEHATYRCD